MKKKNFFAQYKQFTFFLILAVVIILIAVFAPVVSPVGSEQGTYFRNR